MAFNIKTTVLGAGIAVCMSMAANAATTFDDRGAFEAASGTLDLETFDNAIANAPVITFDGGITSSRSGMTNSPNRVGNGSYVGLVTRTQSNLITFDFGAEITAFGADFSGIFSLFADLDNGETVTIADSFRPGGFFGLTSETAFSQLTFRTREGDFGSQLFSLDNLSSGTATTDVAPVPLPASLPLLLAAFGGIGFLRRRKSA